MRGGVLTLFEILLTGAAVVAGLVFAIWLLVQIIKGAIWLLGNGAKGVSAVFRHIYQFISGMFGDALRAVGALITAMVLIPLALLNLLFFRWSTCKHYMRAVEDELISFGLCLYRIALGHPLRLIGMTAVTDGIERRVPDVVARAPHGLGTAANVRDGKFEGYKVTGVLPAGGSGARLFLARPRPEKLQELLAAGNPDPGQVVIKAFSLSTGSTMPQIVRESRALESARKLGLILEHELTDKSFHYVMPFVPGDGLDQVISKMHEHAGSRGLTDKQLRVALGYVGDVLFTLDAYHSGGVWHKDIKPSNLIVSEGRAHLVDLGLVTPLASAMTLTTHGTEYYRDPEMVRLALRGVKVAEVNGAKFDIYSTGAVLFSLMENSFPGQGSLSQLTRRAPDVINWIIRRSMADMDSRYNSVTEMLADVRTVLAADDPYKVRPADLPSVNGRMDQGVPRARFASIQTPPSHYAAGYSSSPSQHTATATKTARRSTGRSLVAAFLGLMFLVGLGGFLLVMFFGVSTPMRTSLQGVGPTSIVLFQEDPAGWCQLNAADFSPSPIPSIPATGEKNTEDAQTAAKQLKAVTNEAKKLARHWGKKLRSELAEIRSSVRAGNQERSTDGTILILEDLNRAEFGPWLTALESELERRKFELVGNRPGSLEDERDILFEAGARKAIGISSSDDPMARQRLMEYVAESAGLDAVIWLEDGKRDGVLRYQLVRPAEGAQSTAAARALSGSN